MKEGKYTKKKCDACAQLRAPGSCRFMCVCPCLLQSTNKFGILGSKSSHKRLHFFYKYIEIIWIWSFIATPIVIYHATTTSILISWYNIRSFHFSFFIFIFCERSRVFNLKHTCAYRSIFAVNALCVLYGLSFVFLSFLHLFYGILLFLSPCHTGYSKRFWYGC